MAKYTLNDIQNYLDCDYRSEDLDDYTMAIDSGFTLLAARMFYSAGCFFLECAGKEYLELYEFIHKQLEKYSEAEYRRDLSECFNNAIVYVNKNTYEHIYLKNDYVDYCIDTDSDWIKNEYVPSHVYYFDFDANVTQLEKIED